MYGGRKDNLQGKEIPLIDLTRLHRPILGELKAAAERVMESGRYILGPEVRAFEEEFAAWVGAKHAVGVASGTDALLLAAHALGLGPGQRVIVPSFTFVATAEVVVRLGAVPLFCDVEPDGLTLDPQMTEDLARRHRPAGVIPVHLYGQMARMEEIVEIAQRYDMWVLEDVAQAPGAERLGRRAGSWGHAAAFSFYPTKNISAMGDGGMVVTDDDALAEKMRRLRVHGDFGKYEYREPDLGYNSRLDELQAALLRVKLRHVDRWNRERREMASWYDRLLPEWVRRPRELPGNLHVYHLYTVRVPKRDQLREFLAQRGVATGVHYPLPLHLQPAFRELNPGSLPVSEEAAREVLSLPLFPGLVREEAERVAEVMREFEERV